MNKLFAFAVIAALGAGTALPVSASTATAQSIWNSNQAASRARQRVPAGAEVTDRHCSSIDNGRNIIWTCKVTWK